MMGNTCVWKPSTTSLHSNYFLMKLFEEAGLPAGVVNFVPGQGSVIGKEILADPSLAGFHFTGSTGTFNALWQGIGNNISNYRCYPKIVGETGGKNFVLAHPSADPREVAVALARGAFEYQGQKCSAASRAYLPKSLWKEIKGLLEEMLSSMKMGDVNDFSNFINAVIDEASFDNIKSFIDHAKKASDAKVVIGGKCDKSVGYFVQPTVIETTNPTYKSMVEEIFGPVLTVYVYEDNEFAKVLKLVDTSTAYGLTGSIFSRDRYAITEVMDALRYSAGNFYINDKPTGAVVGQQPFGGSRASGTNDKAGGPLNLLRWVNPRNIKETFLSPTEYTYPFVMPE